MKMILALGLLVLSTAAFSATYYGKTRTVGGGHAQTFTTVEKNHLTEIGIILTDGALSALPMDMKEYLLPMPKHGPTAPYKHVTLDWNPHGHEPEGVYTKPHFDFHFYLIPNSVRQTITCMGADEATCLKQPAESTIADHYAPTPGGVPLMGWHWVDLLAPEFNGGEFTKTFIYGYYNGAMIFLEPMVTLETLKSKQTSVTTIRRPELFPTQSTSYPDRYKVSYEQKAKEHKVVLKMIR